MTPTQMNLIVTASKGNPGAADAFCKLMEMGYTKTMETIIEYGIVGSDAYVLFSDLCGRDPQKVYKLVKLCPKDTLIDASSRQDYSGRELVRDFLNA